MSIYTEEQVKDIIERNYGFKRELIRNACPSGLSGFRFEVNGIKYCGHTPFSGAMPMIWA